MGDMKSDAEGLRETTSEAIDSIPNNIRKIRREWGLSQGQLADILRAADLEVGQTTVSDWENGKTQISARAVITYSLMFNITPQYVLGLDDSPQPLKTELDFGDDELEKALEDLQDIDPSRYDDYKEIVIFITEKTKAVQRGQVED